MRPPDGKPFVEAITAYFDVRGFVEYKLDGRGFSLSEDEMLLRTLCRVAVL